MVLCQMQRNIEDAVAAAIGGVNPLHMQQRLMRIGKIVTRKSIDEAIADTLEPQKTDIVKDS